MAFYGKTGGEWQQFSNLNTYKDFAFVVCTDDGGDGGSVVRIAEDGTASLFEVQEFNEFTNGVVVDSDFNAYAVSRDGTVKKLDGSNGSILAQNNNADNFTAVALSPDEQTVYAGSQENGLFRYSASDLTLQESIPVGGNVNGVEVGKDGNVVSTSAQAVVKIDPTKIDDSSNGIVWTVQADISAVNNVVVGDDGSVYEVTRGDSLRKIDSTGDVVWSFNGFDGVVDDVVINESTGELYGVASSNIRKVDNQGNELFAFTNLSSEVNTISIDENGKIYIGQENGTVLKLEDTGSGFNQIWSFDPLNTIRGTDVIFTT